MTKPAKVIQNYLELKHCDKAHKNNKNQNNDLAEKQSPVPMILKTAGKPDRKNPLTQFENSSKPAKV